MQKSNSVIDGLPRRTSGKEYACQGRRHKKTWVQSLGWEDPLEEGMATHFNILAWRIPWKRSLAGYSPQNRSELDMTKVN